MPRLITSPDLPERAAAAQRALATGARLEVIRFLTDRPDSAAGAIREGTGLNRDTLRHALEDLQESGFVTVDGGGEVRERHRLRYSVDRVALARAMSELYAYVLDDGDHESAPPAFS